jgi:cytochrome c-type biogenesis protein CcmH/NrfG
MRPLRLLFGPFLLLVAFGVLAEGPDDQFIRIYNSLQQADALVEGGQWERARQGYLDAQEGLKRLQKSNPTWNEKVIEFRLNYVAQKLSALTAESKAVAPQEVSKPVPPSSAQDESADQIKLLQAQVRQLSADRDALQARLKEALSAQPASVDPRELAKAEDIIKGLQKGIEVVKVNLAKAEAKPDRPIDPAAFAETKKALAEANQKHAQQAEVMAALRLERDALQSRLHSFADGAEFKALREENTRLKNELSNPETQTPNEAKASELKGQLAVLQMDLATQKSRNEVLASEKKILEDRLKELELKRNSDLAARTRGLEKELTEAKAIIRSNAAAMSGMQSALRIAHEEKSKLEKGKVDLETALAAAQAKLIAAQVRGTGSDRSNASDTEKVRRLERERDELQKQFNAATKELYDNRARIHLANMEQLTNQVAVLRSRLDVLEARKVPYSEEELAILKKSGAATMRADTKSGKKPSNDLSSGTATLVAEAERAFSARRLEEAEKKYQQALRTDESIVFMLANLAAVQVEQNRLAEAEATLKRGLAADPKDAFSLSLLGILKVRQQNFDEALNALSQSAQLDPQNSDTFQYLGVTLAEKGLRDPAESAFRRAIQLSPGNGDAHHNLAVVYATQRPPAFELARWHYKKSLEAGHTRNPRLERMLNEAGATASSK